MDFIRSARRSWQGYPAQLSDFFRKCSLDRALMMIGSVNVLDVRSNTGAPIASEM